MRMSPISINHSEKTRCLPLNRVIRQERKIRQEATNKINQGQACNMALNYLIQIEATNWADPNSSKPAITKQSGYQNNQTTKSFSYSWTWTLTSLLHVLLVALLSCQPPGLPVHLLLVPLLSCQPPGFSSFCYPLTHWSFHGSDFLGVKLYQM
jgi:hypothetical protein